MTETIKTLIADDHPLMLKGLKQVLETQPNLDIIESEDGNDAINKIRSEKPRIAILDVEMPGFTGFEVAKQVQDEGLDVDIIFLTMFSDEMAFNKAIDVGVRGYVLKENTISEIIDCVKTVGEGKHYLSPAMSEFLMRRNSRFVSSANDHKEINLLTPTEKKVLKQVALMKTSQEIADTFNVSIKTIQNHRNNICNKLNLHGTHALLKFASENASKL